MKTPILDNFPNLKIRVECLAKLAGSKAQTEAGLITAARNYRAEHMSGALMVRPYDNEIFKGRRAAKFTAFVRLHRHCLARPKWASAELTRLAGVVKRLAASAKNPIEIKSWLEAKSACKLHLSAAITVVSAKRREAAEASLATCPAHARLIDLPIRPSRRWRADIDPTLRLDTAREWTVYSGWKSRITADQDHVSGRTGSYRRTVHAADHQADVRGYGVITRSRKLAVAIGNTERLLAAPAGALWDIDQHGIRLALVDARRDDYHPTFDEFRNFDGAAMLSKLTTNRDTRLKHEAEARAAEADAAGVYVCVADSLRAGNCRAGTESWAQKHGLDVRRHYPATEILTRANGDAGRVRIVITAAIRLAKMEQERGYADLADHTVA